MADDKHYVAGDYYRICDMTGFKVRAGRTRKMWTNTIRRDQSWEPRPAQDFVKGVKDDQTVADPRPRQNNVFVGPLGTTLSAALAIGATTATVQSSFGMNNGDKITIMRDDGINQLFTLVSVLSLTSIQFSPGIGWTAASGNEVIDDTAYTQPNIG